MDFLISLNACLTLWCSEAFKSALRIRLEDHPTGCCSRTEGCHMWLWWSSSRSRNHLAGEAWLGRQRILLRVQMSWRAFLNPKPSKSFANTLWGSRNCNSPANAGSVLPRPNIWGISHWDAPARQPGRNVETVGQTASAHGRNLKHWGRKSSELQLMLLASQNDMNLGWGCY